jgi:hypothetical protein
MPANLHTQHAEYTGEEEPNNTPRTARKSGKPQQDAPESERKKNARDPCQPRGGATLTGQFGHAPEAATGDRKTRLIYLGRDREAKAREYSQNYHRLLAIVEEMTLLNMALLKEHAAP